MAKVKGLKVTGFNWSRSALKDKKSLPKQVQLDLIELQKEMCAGYYTPSRNLKPRKGRRKNQTKLWQARLPGSFRVTFMYINGVATFDVVV